MRAIQITMDERLLKELDADPEVKQVGRSLVLRRAAFEYLRRKRRTSIADAYRRGYGKKGAPELAGWSSEGKWPER